MPRDNFIEIDDGDSKHVEKILTEKTTNEDHQKELLMKRKNCLGSDNSWAPEQEMKLSDVEAVCMDLQGKVKDGDVKRGRSSRKGSRGKEKKKQAKRKNEEGESPATNEDHGRQKRVKRRKSEIKGDGYAFELCLANGDSEKLREAQRHNLTVLSKCQDVLASFDFWRVLDEYNDEVKYPQRPGHEYFVKELGPYVASRARLSENCRGCGNMLDVGDYYFWFPTAKAFVGHHFCQLCVAYVLYHCQVKKEKPPEPLDVKLAYEQSVYATYQAFYQLQFPDFEIKCLK